MDGLGMVVGLIVAVGGLYLFYKLAHLPGFIGAWFRISINIALTLLAIIPGFGWLTRFMIVKDQDLKDEIVREGDRWDSENQKMEMQKKAEEERKKAEAKNVEVYKEHYHDGWVDRENMQVSSDGERYFDPDDGKWHKIED